ncbi:MAG: DUF2079 domain-containing protein, partial [Patescibacteria group bacterium]
KVKKLIYFDLHEAILAVFALTYFIYFTLASFLRYENYYTGRFDLGNMAQTVWNTIHGNFFMLTNPNGTEQVSRLAFHADFILILLSPFYLIWEDPRMLLLIQTAVLTFGGIFVYFLSKEILKNKTVSLALALCFFLNPAVNYTNLFDFHAVSLATTFFLAAFYFIQKKNYVLVLIFLALAGITKEQVWLINALIGLYLVLIHKQKLLGVFIFAISSLIFYFLIWIIIPNSLGAEHFALEFYSDFGSSPADVIKGIATHPVQTIQTLLLPDRIGYMKQLFMPLGYMSFLAPVFLIFASPDLGINHLSNFPPMHQIYYQYSATVTPFIFLSTIYGIKFVKSKIPDIPYPVFAVVLILLTLISAYDFGPLPFARKPNMDMFNKPLSNKMQVDNYIKMIPPGESISATNNLGSHLSHRRNIYVVPQGIGKADRVMFLMRGSSTEAEEKILTEMELDPNYFKIREENNFYVFKRFKP